MSRIALASPDTAFESRLRRALASDLDDEDVRAWSAPNGNGDVAAVARAIAAGGAEVVAVGPDMDVRNSMAFALEFDRNHPEVSVLLVAEPTTHLLEEALRAGVRDIVAPGAPEEELAQAVRRGLEAARRRRGIVSEVSEPEAKARVIMTMSPKGGAGKTTMSTNVAIGLARQHPRDVVLVDLDLQFGDVASALRLMPEYTLKDACQLGEELDATSLKVFLTPHPVGLFALTAPESPEEADGISGSQISTVIEALTNEFGYVVIDTDSGFSEAVLATIDHATDLVLVCATDVPTVRAMRKEITTLERIGATKQRRHFVLNRSDARVGLSRKDIESTIGTDIDVAIPSSRLVPQSLNQGTAVLESDDKSPAVKALRELVSRFQTVGVGASSPQPPVHQEAAAETPESGGGLRLWPFTRRNA